MEISLKEGEVLKPIAFGDGRYSVSNFGNVYNTQTGRKLKQNTIKFNYKQVRLYPKNEDQKCLQVHRLVAKAFIPNPLNLPMVNHLDKNPSNNHVNNLEWCTASRNVQHSYDTGRVPMSGNDHPMSKLDEAQVLIIRTLFKDLPIKQIADYFRVTTGTIISIKNFQTWAQPSQRY